MSTTLRPSSQRGAMFGLDARIAIGVLAVLAMVVGYLAFGRVGTARDVKLIHTLQSIEEALGAYQTDMGTFYLFTLDKDKSEDGIHDIEALWDVSYVLPGFQKNWHGPYLHNTSRSVPPYGKLSVFYAQPDRKNTCDTRSECYLWLALSGVPADTWKTINRALDEAAGKSPERGGLDVASGKIQADGNTDPRQLLMRTIARPH